MEEIKAATEDLNLPVQTTFNAEYSYTESGKLKNKLVASKLERYMGENQRIEISEGFEMFIYDSLQNIEAVLTAENGVYFENIGRMEAHHNVVFKNNKNQALYTEELIWLQDSAKVYTDKLVKIESDDGIIYGNSLVTDDKFSKYTLTGISGTLDIKTEQNDTIANEEAE